MTTTQTSLEPRLHAGHMEVAVAALIGWRQNTIVPNVSWGLGLRHECDLLVLDSKGRFTEIEIKISKSDLKADQNKMHGHSSAIISRLVYAVPEHLANEARQQIPKSAGLISVKWSSYRSGFVAKWEIRSRHNRNPKPDQQTVTKFMELGCMRIWSLKTKLHREKQ